MFIVIVVREERPIALEVSTTSLTKVGLVLTALDLYPSWAGLDEKVSHQLFQRIPYGREGLIGHDTRMKNNKVTGENDKVKMIETVTLVEAINL